MYAIIEINQGYIERDIILCDSIEAVELYLISEYKDYGKNYFKSYFFQELNLSYEEYTEYCNLYIREEDSTDLLVRIRCVIDNKIHSILSMDELIFEKKL